MELEHIPKTSGLYTQRNKIHWAPEIKLQGSVSLTEERNESKCSKYHVDDDHDFYYSRNFDKRNCFVVCMLLLGHKLLIPVLGACTENCPIVFIAKFSGGVTRLVRSGTSYIHLLPSHFFYTKTYLKVILPSLFHFSRDFLIKILQALLLSMPGSSSKKQLSKLSQIMNFFCGVELKPP
jgi:hypothetical protein